MSIHWRAKVSVLRKAMGQQALVSSDISPCPAQSDDAETCNTKTLKTGGRDVAKTQVHKASIF